MKDLNILHANIQTLVRLGLRTVLFKGGGINKLDDVETLEDLNQSLSREHYDLVIIGHDENFCFGQNAIVQLQKRYEHLKFLVISSGIDEKDMLVILESGVCGCITKGCNEDEIVNAVFSIAKGEKFFCNKIIDIILQKHLYQKEEDCAHTTLSRREAEVTGLIASGMTNKEVADRLFLSTHTVHTHRKNIMKKLNLKSVSELTIYAVNTGLYKPE